MIEKTLNTTIVRCANPEAEWIDITPFGADRPLLLEQWRGWVIELWCYWEAVSWG